jgi:hypothetical protein
MFFFMTESSGLGKFRADYNNDFEFGSLFTEQNVVICKPEAPKPAPARQLLTQRAGDEMLHCADPLRGVAT